MVNSVRSELGVHVGRKYGGKYTCVCERSMTNCSRFGSSDVGESKQGHTHGARLSHLLLLKWMFPAALAASPQTLVSS